MEHRWGERIAVHQTVELACGSLPPVAGLLVNVSSSGAFVRTQGQGPPRGPVEVIMQQGGFGRAQAVRLPAYVVRQSETGVGIEWCEFAPRAIRELISRDRRTGAVRARASALRMGPHSTRETNMAAQPGAQAADTPAPVLAAAR